MKTQLVVTTDNNALIEELKIVIERFIGQYKNNTNTPITIETKIENPAVFDDIRQLKGILNQYYDKPLTDDDIKNGIHQGIMDRAMLS